MERPKKGFSIPIHKWLLEPELRSWAEGLIEKNKLKLDKIESMRLEMKAKRYKTKAFIDKLKSRGDLITEFDEQLWYSLIEKVSVNRDGTLNFEFKNGKN